jgi:hypothetical protein
MAPTHNPNRRKDDMSDERWAGTKCTNCGRWIPGWQPYACAECMAEEWEHIKAIDARRAQQQMEAEGWGEPIQVYDPETGVQSVLWNGRVVEEI